MLRILLPAAVAFLLTTTGCESLIRCLGLGHPDKVVLTSKILQACADLRSRLESGQNVTETDFVAFDPNGNLGLGEHAALRVHFGFGEQRRILTIDIGRRPEDAPSQVLSVLRIFDQETFNKYVDKGEASQQGISFLCPDLASRTMAMNVLHDMAPFLNSPHADPIEWKFNLLFHNCARYVQLRLADVVNPPELKELVATYREDEIITPTQFGEHLAACELIAEKLALGGSKPVTGDMITSMRHYLKTLPGPERMKWLKFIKTHDNQLGFAAHLQ